MQDLLSSLAENHAEEIDKSEYCINNCEECKVIHREKQKKYCRECKQKKETFSEFGNYYYCFI